MIGYLKSDVRTCTWFLLQYIVIIIFGTVTIICESDVFAISELVDQSFWLGMSNGRIGSLLD